MAFFMLKLIYWRPGTSASHQQYRNIGESLIVSLASLSFLQFSFERYPELIWSSNDNCYISYITACSPSLLYINIDIVCCTGSTLKCQFQWHVTVFLRGLHITQFQNLYTICCSWETGNDGYIWSMSSFLWKDQSWCTSCLNHTYSTIFDKRIVDRNKNTSLLIWSLQRNIHFGREFCTLSILCIITKCFINTYSIPCCKLAVFPFKTSIYYNRIFTSELITWQLLRFFWSFE